MYVRSLLLSLLFCFFIQLAKANFYAKELPNINEKEVGAIKYIYKDKVNRYILATEKGIYVQKDNQFYLLKQNAGLKINSTKLVVTDGFILIVSDSLNNFYSTVLDDIENVKWVKNNKQHIGVFNQLIKAENASLQQWLVQKNTPIAYKQGFFKTAVEQVQVSNCIIVKYQNIWYEIVNSTYRFKTNALFPNVAPRVVFPISANVILLSFDADKSLFIYNTQNDEVVDVCKQNLQVLQGVNSSTFLHAFKGANNDVFLLGGNSKLYNLSLSSNKITLVETLNKLGLDLKNLTVAPNGMVYFGTYKGDVCQYNYINKQTKIFSKDEYVGLNDVNRLYIDEYGLLWVGMVKNFAVINPDKNLVYIPTSSKNINLLNNNVTAFARVKNDLWVGSYQTGLWHITLPENFNGQLNLNASLFESFSDTKKIYDHNIKFLNTKNDTVIVRSLNSIILLTKNNKIFKQIQLDDEVGASLQNQYNYLLGSNYFTGISGGFCIIHDITTPVKQISTPNIEEIITLNFTKSLPFNWVNNALISLNDADGYISFTPSFYNSTKNTKPFTYAVDGVVSTSLTNGSAIILLPKKNSIRVTIFTLDGIASADGFSFIVKINRPWYASLLFKIICATLLLSLLGFIIYLKKRSNQFKNAATINEITSLRGQLNPHFISNSLNSINAFVLQNKSEQASDYIVKFAKLMHLILQNSTQEFITIEEELKMLNTYLEMEKLRFKDKFSYSISNKVKDLHYLMPSMILQPFVENAIWHGLLQQKSNGLLQIVIEPSGKNIMITITDNGIGRKASEEIKSKQTTKRKSYGMQIVQKRIVLLEKLHNRKYSLAIIDLQNPTGTQVKLIL